MFEASLIISIYPKWRIFVLTLPLTILFALAKLLFHQQGWELWTFNALTSSLFGAATFIIALLLIGSEEITESIVISSLLFIVFLYLLLLIKDWDNPFQYGGFSSVDSSLTVLDESIDRLSK